MKVSIRWFGEGLAAEAAQHSKVIATALKEWIPRVLQTAEPILSDIISKSTWLAESSSKLRENHIEIICHFEGALTTELGAKAPYPRMFDEMGLNGPLTSFQAVRADKPGTLQLIKALNTELLRIPDAVMRETFEKWWPELETALHNVRKQLPNVPVPKLELPDDLAPCGWIYYSTAVGLTNDTGESIPEARLIRKAIDEERLLIVVGAGVSMSATKGARESYWQGLLESGLETINDSRKKRVLSDLLAQNDSKSATYVAEAIEDALGGRSDFAFYSWLQETVGRLRPINRDVLEVIRDLHVPVATTNYDRLLEEVMGRRPITFDDVEESLSFVRNENVNDAILHIHGYYARPKSVVFGTRSYYALLESKKYAEAILRALASRYTWLFVGCGKGLQDPHFEDFIRWMQRTLGNRIPWHYQLLAQDDQLAPLVKGGRIRPISYGKTHEDLAAFLRSLIRSARIRASSDQPGQIIHPLELCTGRDSELRAFRKALLQDYPKPIGILGGSGLGKTTFCYAGFYSPDVVTHYRKRHYVRLDAATSGAAMLQAIARELGLQAPAALAGSFSNRSRRHLLDRIVDKVKEDRMLLVLDGVERPWHPNESETEAYLAKLCEGAAASNSAVVAIVTGYRRPLNVPWGLRIDLTPLSDEDGSRLFIEVAKNVARERDENVPTLSESDALGALIKTLDGIPPAIKIMAHTAAIEVADRVVDKKGGGTGEDWDLVLSIIRNQWQKKRDDSLTDEDGSRLFIDVAKPVSRVVSLRIAVSALEKNDKDNLAKKLLGIMGLLPDGLPENFFETDLRHLSIGAGTVDALKLRGLVFVQDGRIRSEPFIRQFAKDTLESEIDDGDKQKLVIYYFEKADIGEAIGWGTRINGTDTDTHIYISGEIETIKAEANNIEEIIRHELQQKDSQKVNMAIRKALALGRFYRFSGHGSPKIVEDAYRKASEKQENEDSNEDRIELKADCSRVLGSMQRLRSQFEKAKESYKKAYNDYDLLSDGARRSLGHAHCERARGDMEKDKGEAATQTAAVKHYEDALREYDNALISMSAEATKTTARGWQAKRGRAWCLANIGDLKHRSREYGTSDSGKSGKVVEEAKDLYIRAANEYKALAIRDKIGEAHCEKGLGDISCIKSFNPEKGAREYYATARDLYLQSGYKIGIADCEYSLGDEALRSDDSNKAKQHYVDALKLYDQIGSLHGVANCLYSLGDVQLRDSRKADKTREAMEADKMEAKKHYRDALKRYEEIESRLGPANCHQGLGDISSGQERDDERKKSAAMLWQAFGNAGVVPSFTFGENWKRWRR